MPGQKVPSEMCSFAENYTFEENYKADSLSSRSSSPKSVVETDYSVSESSESPEGSIISDYEIEADRIANDLDNMKITEIQAEEMMKEGADVRHVLTAAWKLKPKITKKFKKGTKLTGKAVLKLLNFDYNEQDSELDQQQRMSRAWAQYEKSLNRRSKAPPGFENIDDIIARKKNKNEKPECLVSYANGTNTLNLSTEPIIVHDITVSCVVDSCHAFVQQMKNPTFEGLNNLEEEITSTYSMEPAKELLRPIAHGSVLAVFTDDKWYRCQVVSFNSVNDTCDIKFVDHGGFTTVAVSSLRQLKSDFLRLPFQAIEVYLAHVKPTEHEVQTDIASEILFHKNISIQLLGMADDGLPMVQAYYYDGDYINIFTQEVIDTCMVNIPAASTASEEYVTETEGSSSESNWAEEVEEAEAKTAEVSEVSEVAPNSAEVLEAPQYYPTEYYCQESGSYYQTENCQPLNNQQPTIAYVYNDEHGYQQVYYVAGPYMIPAVPSSEELNTPPSETESSSDSAISFGSFSPVDTTTQEEEESSSDDSAYSTAVAKESNDFINKPFEEWTQEDYAKYYGQ
eukprot:GFUD01008903.1.p1 GENE.GFUD01008903.1~~GFUD01008903.1.p1  ORF type:complete len:568 (+),score=160.88 GFUD01008903.1:205-1908(+)